MNLKFTVIALAAALSGSVYAQQIVEQTFPLVPVSPTDQQIMAVQQAERQIQANEQAIALEKARAAQRQAKANAAAAAKRRAAQAKVNEKKAAEAAQKKAYDDEMRQIDLEMKKLDLELKRSNVKTRIDMNDIAQRKAELELQKEMQAPGAAPAVPAPKAP